MSSITASQTPCPATHLDPSHRRVSSFELFGEDTANIDYTRAIDQPLTGIKPRRRSMVLGPPKKKAAPITIFEDVGEEEEMNFGVQESIAPAKSQASVLLGRPAAKRPQGGRPSIGVGTGNLGTSDGRSVGIESGSTHQSRGVTARPRMSMAGSRGPVAGQGDFTLRRMNGIAEIRTDQALPAAGNTASARATNMIGSTVRKPPRRQTIFVPEDTTVMTIHPGARDNTGRIDDTFHLPRLPVQHPSQSQTHESTEQEPVRKPRQSLMAAPKRLPLRETPSTENMPGWDVAGANTGKENLPPAGRAVIQKSMKPLGVSGPAEPKARPRSLYAPTQATRNRQSIVPRPHAQLTTVLPPSRPGLKGSLNNGLRPDRPRHEPIRSITRVPVTKFNTSNRASIDSRAATKSALDSTTHSTTAPTYADEEKQRIRDFIASKRSEQQVAKLQKYAVLEGNLSEPALYEDKWLSYQETALTEVINRIFEVTSPAPTIHITGKPLRDQLIEIYNRPEVTMLHSRLQASLSCGALAHPRSTVSAHQPSQDLALRRRLMRMWLDTFNHKLLAEAVQVVAGRQISRSPTSSPGSSLDPKAGKRDYMAFLEDFFVCVVDVDTVPKLAGEDSDFARWEKTMLRSLMLIWLLDQAAESGIVDGGCLIKSTSEKKTTTAIVQMLGGMMLPACGDIMRVLKHLQYEINYSQDALHEVVYRVDNIAKDFRDGVFLTRLVETLAYDNRALSQCLKLPATGHSQQAYNVQVSLQALSNHSVAACNVVGDIEADDIVNGHREKSLSLLWSLVSTYGLPTLIDWTKLTADINRISGSTASTSDTLPSTPLEQEDLLRQWASAYAEKVDIRVDNLSTSFTDGQVYSAILDAFTKYLPIQQEGPWTSPDPMIVHAQLRAFGCSNAFAEKLAGSIGVVTSQETVVSNLAFLASRLLPLVPHEEEG
ncbi:Putative calponin domain, CH domain superfamily [Septoria linicola]|uniref:Calponin domain, CH domain superfamily n=1 Tax=Septoria linicola TaxID=215465 RepID=A0A9Q9ESF1_9PEZI|nr:Putative calponin domain, CH domain superfamily [Septoria linicola]